MFQRKKSATELHSKELHKNDEDVKITTHKKRYISPEERQQIIDELRLVPKKDVFFLEINDELMLKLKNIHIFRKRTTNY